MEAEKFRLGKRTVEYRCGCKIEIFSFETKEIKDLCPEHGEPICGESNMVDEI